MKLKAIGEFGLIERFKKRIRTDASVIVGSGDDCAVLKYNKEKYQLFTCDMIVEGVDFTLKDKPDLIGRKALAVSISDIAACGGIPNQAVVSLGLPKKLSLSAVDRLAAGLFNLAREFRINIVGGDISRAEKLVIDVSMLGLVEKNCLALRRGAKKGDFIFVSGALGGSIRGKHLKFTPRLKEARLLVKNYKINSLIDISDGLTQDLGHILKESNVGACIYEELIPKSKAACNLNEALYMGEDFELLFTLSRKESARLMARKPRKFIPIGEIRGRKEGFVLIDRKGRIKPVLAKGFRHF